MSYHYDRRTFLDDLKRDNEKKGPTPGNKYKKMSKAIIRQREIMKKDIENHINEEQSSRIKPTYLDQVCTAASETPGPGQ